MRDLEFAFMVPGMPHGKERARTYFDRRQRRYRSYTPDSTASYEQSIGIAFNACGGKFVGRRPVMVDILAVYPIPKSTSRETREKMLSGKIVPHRTPDLDNIIKSVLDGLNGVAYTDDSYVAACTAQKVYGEAPYVHVTIWTDTDLCSKEAWLSGKKAKGGEQIVISEDTGGPGT